MQHVTELLKQKWTKVSLKMNLSEVNLMLLRERNAKPHAQWPAAPPRKRWNHMWSHHSHSWRQHKWDQYWISKLMQLLDDSECSNEKQSFPEPLMISHSTYTFQRILYCGSIHLFYASSFSSFVPSITRRILPLIRELGWLPAYFLTTLDTYFKFSFMELWFHFDNCTNFVQKYWIEKFLSLNFFQLLWLRNQTGNSPKS